MDLLAAYSVLDHCSAILAAVAVGAILAAAKWRERARPGRKTSNG